MAKQNDDALLADKMGEFYANPLGFVQFAYDWDYGELKGFDGPDVWQSEYLEYLGWRIRKNNFDGVHPVDPVQMATSSGHGIGKSALTAWLADFIMSTRPYSKGVITANTSPQLRTKTWAELSKWTKRCITGHWFNVSSGGQFMAMYHKENPDTWRVDAQTCAKENSEAFAGLHAANSTPWYIFDEASAIDNVIWEVAEGGMTDGEPMWFVFGNPTRGSGRFFDCFGKQKHRWRTAQIDSRTAKMTNKKKLQEWVDDFGEDSDFVRVRVRGVFPRAGSCQFIAGDIVRAAMLNQLREDIYALQPKCLGVDVARFGDDQTVFTRRQGRKVWPQEKYRGLDTMQTASRACRAADDFGAEFIFVDGVGVGAGVVDRMRQLGYAVIDVQAGGGALDKVRYKNKRAEMWGQMRDWIKNDSPDLPDDNDLEAALTAIEYGFTPGDQILLERKEDMKKRGVASPDEGDSLALTFAEPTGAQGGGGIGGLAETAETEYDLFAY